MAANDPAFKEAPFHADPFNSAAPARLIRMGILKEDKSIDDMAVDVFAKGYAGLFFDALYDFYDDKATVSAILKFFSKLRAHNDYFHMYLYLSLSYDNMGTTMPDPIWWIAGQEKIIARFMTTFLGHLEAIQTNDGQQAARRNCGE